MTPPVKPAAADTGKPATAVKPAGISAKHVLRAEQCTQSIKQLASQAGYPCPHCGAATQVVDSRRTSTLEGQVTLRRRRACINKKCRKRLTTYELVDRNMAKYMAVASLLDSVMAIHHIKVAK